MTLESGLEIPTEKSPKSAVATKSRRWPSSAPPPATTCDSDVDIMTEFFPKTKYGLLEYQAIEDELAALFGRKVDLGTKKYIKPRLRDHILRESRVIYAA